MATGNPFTNAQAPQAMQMLAPDIAAQQMQVARQQRIADMLREQSMAPSGNTDVIGGWAVKKSPFEGMAKMASALMARSSQQTVDDKQLALAKAMQGRMGDVFDSMSGGSSAGGMSPQGSAAPAAPTPQGVMGEPGAMPPDSPAPAAAPQPATQMSQIDRIRNQAKAAYIMGNTDLSNKLLENISTLTESQRNMAAMGQNPLEMGRLGTAAARKAGIIELQPGTTALDLSNGQERFQPKVGEGISLNNGVASQIPGYAGANAGIVGAAAGATAAANAGQKMVTINTAKGPVMMTEAQAVQQSGGGAPAPAAPGGGGFIPAGPAPSAPSGGPVDLNHLTPQERQTLMARAQAQFGLQPGAAPGTSVQAAPAPAGQVGIRLKTPAQEAQELAAVQLSTKPALDLKSKEFGDMADYGKTLDGHVSESQALLQRVEQSRQALAKFQAGGGGEMRSQVAQWAQAIPGMPTSIVDKIAGGDLSASQEFQKYAAQEALGTMQQALASDSGKGSQGNRVAMQLFIKNNPNIDTDPRAIEKIFNFQTTLHNQIKAQADAYHQYKDTPGNDPSKFPNYWASEAIKRGFVTPEIKSGYAKGVATPPNVQALLDKYK